MPQVDLRPLFAPPSGPEPPPKPPAENIEVSGLHTAGSVKRGPFGLNGVQWTNLAFVICACLGALFSVVYLFKGELVQEVAAWPRELFRGRAVPAGQTVSVNDQGRIAIANQPLVAAPAAQNDNSGDPFSSVHKSLTLDRFKLSPNRRGGPPSPSFSRSSSVFSSLDGSTVSTAAPAVTPGISANNPIAVPSISSTVAVPPTQTAALATGPLQQANAQVQTANTAMKATTARAASTASRIAARTVASRSSRSSGATRAVTNTKTSFFKSLFRVSSKRALTSKSKLAGSRTKSAIGRSANAANKTGRRNLAQRSHSARGPKSSAARVSLGKTSAKTTAARKAAVGRKSAAPTAMILSSESSRIPRPSASASVKPAMPGINGAASGLKGFGNGGGLGPRGMGMGGIGGGHGFGRGGGR